MSKIKDKSGSSRLAIDNAKRHVFKLTTPDLSDLDQKADSDDVDMSDIMSVLDQTIDKELTLSHSPAVPTTSIQSESTGTAVKRKDVDDSQTKYVEK